MELGMVVSVIYPRYAAGLTGTVVAQENNSGRWLIKLEGHPFEDNGKPILLSLEESDIKFGENHEFRS